MNLPTATTQTKQDLIQSISFGNLQVLQFTTIAEVDNKLHEIREKCNFKNESANSCEIYGWDFNDYVAERFEQVYDINPNQLKEILGN